MRTTALNPTVWLLAATAVAALVGSARNRGARAVVEIVVRWACAWAVLIPLTALAVFGVGSRVVLGYLSAGSYAEEVVAARTFLASGRLYSANGRGDLDDWLSAPAGMSVPWGDLPGVTPCQANALENRERFYTAHAHSPMLLLAAVPVVAFAGGKGLFVLLVMLSIASVAVMWTAAVSLTGFALRSREGLLILVAVSAWQPVLAGIRQGDAVLPAAGLVVCAWRFGPWRRRGPAALAAAAAACLALPAAGALAALWRSSARTGALALGAYALMAGATLALAGFQTLPDHVRIMGETARTYAEAIPNYALAGRLLNAVGAVGAVAVAALIVLVSWARARSLDAAFAVFAAAGLLVAPILWSQHLSLAFIPAVLLLRRVVSGGSSLALGGWAVLMLVLSLPDPAVIAFTRAVGSFAPLVPVVSFAVFALWVSAVLIDRPSRVAALAGSPSTAIRVIP